MRKRSHLQQEFSSVPAIVELLETRRVASEMSVVQVANSSNVDRITPVVQFDRSGNPTVNEQTYAENVSLFRVFAQNGAGYVPGSEFLFDFDATANNFLLGISMEDEGNRFWI